VDIDGTTTAQDQTGRPSSVPVIRAEDLAKYYTMGDSVVHALDGVNLTIDPGELVAITGPSGSGKSTMMHLIGCLERPTRGWYELNGQRVSDLSSRELAAVRNKSIGFVFQTFNLINRTSAVDNVSLPLFYARKTRVREPAIRALERVGMANRASHRSNELSGGERQRVAIARALVNEPSLLLADEPTGNLDSRTGAQILELFHTLNEEGVTVVIVTHDPEVASETRRTVAMLDGKIIDDRPNGSSTRCAMPRAAQSATAPTED
jgi:putative ABC transport system ATP-binding protein